TVLSPYFSISSRPTMILAAVDWRRCSVSLPRPVISTRSSLACGAEAGRAAAAGADAAGAAAVWAPADAAPPTINAVANIKRHVQRSEDEGMMGANSRRRPRRPSRKDLLRFAHRIITRRHLASGRSATLPALFIRG